MTIHLRYRLAAGLLAIGLASVGMAQTLTPNVKVPSIPKEIQAPAGNIAFLEGHAFGTQDYVCLPTATGFGWSFYGPQATLFASFKYINSDMQQQFATHFLSGNVDENGTARVTWQSSFDSSKVWGKAMASTTDPAFVASAAIPWVLLEAVGTEKGPTGGTVLAHTTFIQRLNTSGGVAPSGGCSQASNVGASALVPYTADYFFYRAVKAN